MYMTTRSSTNNVCFAIGRCWVRTLCKLKNSLTLSLSLSLTLRIPNTCYCYYLKNIPILSLEWFVIVCFCHLMRIQHNGSLLLSVTILLAHDKISMHGKLICAISFLFTPTTTAYIYILLWYFTCVASDVDKFILAYDFAWQKGRIKAYTGEKKKRIAQYDMSKHVVGRWIYLKWLSVLFVFMVHTNTETHSHTHHQKCFLPNTAKMNNNASQALYFRF